MKINEIISESVVKELAYPGNIGIMELTKFFQTATDDQKKHFKKLKAEGKMEEAWHFMQSVVGVKLHEDDLEELAYPKNVGIIDLAKFFKIATPAQKATFKKLAGLHRDKEAWALYQEVTGNKLEEGGWASTQTQGTKITPQLVQHVMKLLSNQFIPQLNKFLASKSLAPTEISAPGGSATYYERDLAQDPTREYGDVDVQFHIPRIEGTTNNENSNIYSTAIKEFCDSTQNYSTNNGTNIILKVGKEYVQVDLVASYYENKNWTRALRPAYQVKGVLCNSLYSSLGEALSLSFGGGHGIQAKTVNGELVPFRTVKNTTLQTITNNPDTWGIDIVKYFGCAKISPLLKQYPGTLDEPRISDIINSFKGIAQTLEMAGKQSATDLLQQVKSIYLAKITKSASSSKFDKAASPEAIDKANHTKEMLASKSAEIAAMLDK